MHRRTEGKAPPPVRDWWPTVVVRWDPMPDVKGKEDLSDETQQVLPPRKWNKDVEGAWRMDINVRFVENTEDYEGVCGV